MGTKHKWSFPSRFRAHSYSWKASRLAAQRIREAVREISAAGRRDPCLAAAGAVLLIEKLVRAIEFIDSSSGTLGAAVNKAMDDLAKIIGAAEADSVTRDGWLERVWEAVQADGYSYLDTLPELWGDLCGGQDTASRWADRFREAAEFPRAPGGYSHDIPACLSCLLAAGRCAEVLELLETETYPGYRRFGAKALLRLGRPEEALRYAGDDVIEEMAQTCEEILVTSGNREEAYRRYALARMTASPGWASFCREAKRYPEKDRREILQDVLATTLEPGKWFAKSRRLALLDLAAELATRSPTDPKTLSRGAREHLAENPEFTLKTALASLHWLALGYGYEITAADVYASYSLAVEAARRLGREEDVAQQVAQIVAKDTTGFVRRTLGARPLVPRRVEAPGSASVPGDGQEPYPEHAEGRRVQGHDRGDGNPDRRG